jgi:hypothetical protein
VILKKKEIDSGRDLTRGAWIKRPRVDGYAHERALKRSSCYAMEDEGSDRSNNPGID